MLDTCGLGGALSDNAAMLAAITQFHDMLDVKIGAVALDVTLLHQDLGKAEEQMSKTRVCSIEDSIEALQQKINTPKVVTKERVSCIEDAKGCAQSSIPAALTVMLESCL
ncbi:hypothetical protein NDU88_004618 [Pleurodeles waltl]|uniref:Uncharacterized protein n=1 Tax=Pleurodeles waltl TaxID=8319 RepID=A0AAV7N3I8_PLEWA|nr:hypothetical protein NDU88_004618 [Pleurodeles waltl]